MATNSAFCLALKDGPVWVKLTNIFESPLQPNITLMSQDNEQVKVPATSLLASSVVLRQVIGRGNYLPVAHIAPVVIIPGVTVNVLKHVVEIVTTGKCEVGERGLRMGSVR